MAVIRTLRGDIPPQALGICHPHEHLIGAPPAEYAAADPDLVLDSEDAALAALHELRQAGARALVEMTPIDYHRHPAALRRLSEAADMHIIGVTGYLKEKFCRPFVEDQTAENIAQRMAHEIEQGMDDTNIRAGVIKAASSLNSITENEQKVFMAAALAHQQTGALISTHTEAGTMALEQITLLTEAGVPPGKILIGHLDRHLDADYHQRIAATGVYMGFDQISKRKYAPDTQRIAMIKRLIAAGHAGQIMLSMDIARRSGLPGYGGAPGFAYLLRQFVPMLRATDVPEATINGILVENPARALALQP